MAYKRLVVERNALLVWFGVVSLVLWFAFIRAEGVKTLDDIIRTLTNEAHSLLWIAAPFLLCTYSIFVGLGLRWWRDVRVDRDNRRVKTDRGAVLAFDQIGALSVTNAGLVAEGIAEPLYRGYRPEVRREALDAVLGRGGRAQLHRLRRLSVHRSWRLFVFALMVTAAATFLVVNNIVMRGSNELEYILMAVVAYALCLVWFRLALFGSYRVDQPYVDVTAGVLRLRDGAITRFDDLGALSVEKRVVSYSPTVRHPEYTLRAANLAQPIDQGLYDHERMQKQLAALETAILEYKLRRVLETPAVENDAFRAGVDPIEEARRIAGQSPHRRAAVEALARDPDPTVRDRARALLR